MWRLVFLLIPLSALWYALRHVWLLLPLPVAGRWGITLLCLIAFLLLFVCTGKALDKMPSGVATAVYYTGTTSLIVLLYTVIIFFLLDLLTLVRVLPASALHDNWLTISAVAAVIVALLAWGNITYHDPKRQLITLTTDKPTERDLTIVMASDLHLGYHIRRNELHDWVEMINAEHPDIVLFAGDIIDRSIRPLREDNDAAELKRINAPVYACPGNHEYYCGVDNAMAFYRSAGIVMLRDSAVNVSSLTIAGRDDSTNKRRKTLSEILRDVNSDSFIILLNHQPRRLDEAADAGADFQFSGHTHHGQVFPASLVTDLVYTCAHGGYAINRTRYYVSSGLGIWGGKFRIGTRSEYVVVKIKRGGR
ncbi:MAG: metallophosphoesterase [Prevotella sp.]|nr:metallophosphoesterase [Prevotella sp.]